jgi:hypothetical protein
MTLRRLVLTVRMRLQLHKEPHFHHFKIRNQPSLNDPSHCPVYCCVITFYDTILLSSGTIADLAKSYFSLTFHFAALCSSLAYDGLG